MKLKEKIFLKKEGERVVVICENDASNIQEGSLDRVFERFYRSDEARSSGIEGSGIGLAIAKEIIVIHKGRIFAYGKQGHFQIKAEL